MKIQIVSNDEWEKLSKEAKRTERFIYINDFPLRILDYNDFYYVCIYEADRFMNQMLMAK